MDALVLPPRIKRSELRKPLRKMRGKSSKKAKPTEPTEPTAPQFTLAPEDYGMHDAKPAPLPRHQTNFLDLPREIRHIIYELVFVSPKYIGSEGTQTRSFKRDLYKWRHFAFARSCRLIYEESTYIFFSKNGFMFFFHRPALEFFENIGPARRAMLTKLKFTFNSTSPFLALRYVRSCTILKELEIVARINVEGRAAAWWIVTFKDALKFFFESYAKIAFEKAYFYGDIRKNKGYSTSATIPPTPELTFEYDPPRVHSVTLMRLHRALTNVKWEQQRGFNRIDLPDIFGHGKCAWTIVNGPKTNDLGRWGNKLPTSKPKPGSAAMRNANTVSRVDVGSDMIAPSAENVPSDNVDDADTDWNAGLASHIPLDLGDSSDKECSVPKDTALNNEDDSDMEWNAGLAEDIPLDMGDLSDEETNLFPDIPSNGAADPDQETTKHPNTGLTKGMPVDQGNPSDDGTLLLQPCLADNAASSTNAYGNDCLAGHAPMEEAESSSERAAPKANHRLGKQFARFLVERGFTLLPW